MNTNLEKAPCIVCGNTEFSKVMTVKDWFLTKEDFDVCQCNKCGFRLTMNPPAEDKAYIYYQSENYIEHSDTKKGLVFSVYHYARKWALNFKRKKIQKLSSKIAHKRILDVGSGSGYFINHMKTNGFDVTGVEISDTARELCKKNFDIETLAPNDFLSQKSEPKYDIITMWHVLEHVYQYDAYFERYREQLTGDGHLIIAVPNHTCFEEGYYKEYWCAYDVPRHIWHFEPKTFEKFAERHGFRVVKIGMLPLDSFFNAMLSAEYKPNFTFLPFTFLIGLISYFKGLFNPKRASSPIYYLQKIKS